MIVPLFMICFTVGSIVAHVVLTNVYLKRVRNGG